MKLLLFSALLLIINTVQASDNRSIVLVAMSCRRNEQELVSTYQGSRDGGFYFVKITQNLATFKEGIKVIKTTIKQGGCLPDLTDAEITDIKKRIMLKITDLKSE